jgi:hypothetical protein
MKLAAKTRIFPKFEEFGYEIPGFQGRKAQTRKIEVIEDRLNEIAEMALRN